MAWLPGHALAGSSVATAVAHTSPWRLTTAAHSILPDIRPPASDSFGASRSHFFRSFADGRSPHCADAAPCLGPPLWAAAPPACRSDASLPSGRRDSTLEHATRNAAMAIAAPAPRQLLDIVIATPPGR